MCMRVKTQYKLKTFAKVVFWHTIPPQIEPMGGFCLVGKTLLPIQGPILRLRNRIELITRAPIHV